MDAKFGSSIWTVGEKGILLHVFVLGTAFHVHTAMTLRMRVLFVQANAGEILTSIQKEHAWAWAKNPENNGELSEFISNWKMKQTTWQTRFVTGQPEEFKNMFDAETIATECKTFLEKQKEIDTIEQFVTNLRAKHAVECKLAQKVTDQQTTPKK